MINTEEEKQELKKFFSMQTRMDVCNFFGISQKKLIFLLYINKKNNYKEFYIAKKSGGIRTITAPSSMIKIIQKKLSKILYLYKDSHRSSHGFALNKDIKTNANLHINKKFVLNLDLKDFFNSIHIGRIIGLLMSPSFNFNKEVATILAQICCHKAKLPQGAPTSPIMSNLICHKLDNQLFNFATDNGCNYTRYADDITFSFNSSNTLKKITTSDATDLLATNLKSIIENNIFDINFSKVKLCINNDRQKVTGLIVNKKVNIEKKYLKEVRAILHSWIKNDIEYASNLFYQKNTTIKYTDKTKHEKFIKIINGRLNYIKHIRGKDDFLCRKLENEYNLAMNNKLPILPTSHEEEIDLAIWVIETNDDNGTGFFINNNGAIYFITCAHVIYDKDGSQKDAKIFHPNSCGKKYDIEIIKVSHDHDVVICKILEINEKSVWALKIGKSSELKRTDEIIFNGYPDYGIGHRLRAEKAQFTGRAKLFGIELLRVNGEINGGNSGGPVMDLKNNVIGIACYSKTSAL